MTQLLTLGASSPFPWSVGSKISVSKKVLLLTALTLQITFKLSVCHAQTSLFVNGAEGLQVVQLLNGSNTGQLQAIRLR